MLHAVEPGWRESFQVVAEFLTGEQADVADDRVLATMLFTDIVGSTRRAAEMGDRDWHALLDAHDAVVRSQLTALSGPPGQHGGRRFPCAVRRSAAGDPVRPGDPRRRAGVGSGCAPGAHRRVRVRGDDVGGIAVHIGARVSALAGANVSSSGTVRDLVVGSGWSSRTGALMTSKACPANGGCSPWPRHKERDPYRRHAVKSARHGVRSTDGSWKCRRTVCVRRSLA